MRPAAAIVRRACENGSTGPQQRRTLSCKRRGKSCECGHLDFTRSSWIAGWYLHYFLIPPISNRRMATATGGFYRGLDCDPRDICGYWEFTLQGLGDATEGPICQCDCLHPDRGANGLSGCGRHVLRWFRSELCRPRGAMRAPWRLSSWSRRKAPNCPSRWTGVVTFYQR